MNATATSATGAGANGASDPARLPAVRFAIEPPPDVTSVSNVTVSADGRFVVYEGQVDGESRLFLRRANV